MSEHMQGMQGMMDKMRGMGGGMPMGPGSGTADPAQRQQAMEQRMQMMMDQMLQTDLRPRRRWGIETLARYWADAAWRAVAHHALF